MRDKCVGQSVTNRSSINLRSHLQLLLSVSYSLVWYDIIELVAIRRTSMQASVDNSIRCLSSLLSNFEQLVCRHTAERRRIHNLSSNLAILPTEIIQAILIAGMTPDDTNTDYLRAITQTSRQLRDAALGCSDLWVN